MIEAKGFSIWLIPGDEVYFELQNLITELSLKYSTPNFEPHITLLHGIEDDLDNINKNFILLSKNLSQFQLRFLELKCGEEFFKSIFIEVELNQELTDLYLLGKKLFGQWGNLDFKPHVSLMYSNIKLSRKIEIANSIKISTWEKVIINKIQLMKTIGKVEEWEIINFFPLP
ncbi:MAG: hypothetical protein N3A61_09945 [Ignavibacteria bacterium]|nr:hypothetical protein [Ignavibacteria bacterium]